MKVKVITDQLGLVKATLPAEEIKAKGKGGPKSAGVLLQAGQVLHIAEVSQDIMDSWLDGTLGQLQINEGKLVKKSPPKEAKKSKLRRK